ncbi:signal transduction histidine kinase [Saccharopolyspora erythraea NRRL 2338]|uniref:histidine kinase n=2 Tax=Saccharopolyspora erythraea TaxID=1836 RepID=A4FE91_SACEN|nr:histidine kinase [Saccharopolyspora erythraea]EQD85184.1 histidine kinase [Saccharopolyspora erythraea D]PFG96093.1 signal transduction histidine kinase [Saccharopolyspora erythraea NRRL 2338]QRK92634.1 two-component sensor histidine kinase [Saccharopolyspora erythraea]CAM02366.1 two-component system sensor kinase [Saccharopolyspora erythraea NRRL 2338]
MRANPGAAPARWITRYLFGTVARGSAALAADLAVVAVFSATHVLAVVLEPSESGESQWWPLLVSIPATAVLLGWRRMPWPALLVTLSATVALTAAHASIGALNLVILVEMYAVCLRTSLAGVVLAALVAMVYPVVDALELPLGEGFLRVFGGAVNLVMVIGWGRAMRVALRRERQLEHTVVLLDEARDQIAADAAVVERARIAREFHDVVSHNLSVVALRAGVARAVMERDPDHARGTLRELEETSRSALDEMRNVLTAFREGAVAPPHAGPAPGELEEAERQPAPSLDRVDLLIDRVRSAGVSWRLERRGSVRELGPGVEMNAYRVVQEGITNVLKHAPGGNARVLLEYGNSSLRIEVTNRDANAAAPRPPGVDAPARAGNGLIGLRERVALLGGSLTAHPVPGGFHLAAVLPVSETQAGEAQVGEAPDAR